MSAFTDFVTLELPQRAAFLTVATASYDGDPNDGGAPVLFTNAPVGTEYQQETPEAVLWKKSPDGTWLALGAPDLSAVDQDILPDADLTRRLGAGVVAGTPARITISTVESGIEVRALAFTILIDETTEFTYTGPAVTYTWVTWAVLINNALKVAGLDPQVACHLIDTGHYGYYFYYPGIRLVRAAESADKTLKITALSSDPVVGTITSDPGLDEVVAGSSGTYTAKCWLHNQDLIPEFGNAYDIGAPAADTDLYAGFAWYGPSGVSNLEYALVIGVARTAVLINNTPVVFDIPSGTYATKLAALQAALVAAGLDSVATITGINSLPAYFILKMNSSAPDQTVVVLSHASTMVSNYGPTLRLVTPTTVDPTIAPGPVEQNNPESWIGYAVKGASEAGSRHWRNLYVNTIIGMRSLDVMSAGTKSELFDTRFYDPNNPMSGGIRSIVAGELPANDTGSYVYKSDAAPLTAVYQWSQNCYQDVDNAGCMAFAVSGFDDPGENGTIYAWCDYAGTLFGGAAVWQAYATADVWAGWGALWQGYVTARNEGYGWAYANAPGSSAQGYVFVWGAWSNAGITSDGSGSRAQGYVVTAAWGTPGNYAEILASGAGAVAQGYVYADHAGTATIVASGISSHAQGYVWGSGYDATIEASGSASFAWGNCFASTNDTHITASGDCSLAWGQAEDGADIGASGYHAWQIGVGVNNEDFSISILETIRLLAQDPITPRAGDIFPTAAGNMVIRSYDPAGDTDFNFNVIQSAAYTESNVTPTRAFDADSTSLDELSDVVGTLIADLRAAGLIPT